MILGNVPALYLLSLLVPVGLLYFLRERGRSYPVSALFLWERSGLTRRRQAARFRPRLEALLFLQLMLVALLAFSLADPGLLGKESGVSRLAVLLDGSASMRTLSEDGETRYDKAKAAALELIEELNPGEVIVVQLSSSPRLLVGPQEKGSEAWGKLKDSSPSWRGDGTAAELGEIINSWGGVEDFQKVFLLSDRRWNLPFSSDKLEQRSFSGGENVGIEQFSVRAEETGEDFQIYLKVKNYSSREQIFPLTVQGGGAKKERSVSLPARGSKKFFFSLASEVVASSRSFSAALDVEDDFKGDNRRYFDLPTEPGLVVDWRGKGNFYLERALEAYGPLKIAQPGERADLTVAYDTTLPASTKGDLLAVNSGIEGILKLNGEVSNPRLELRRPSDLLLRGVDPEDLFIASASLAEVSVPGKTVIEAEGSPLLFRTTKEGGKVVFLGGDLSRSNLPLTVDFPLLIGNVLRWFGQTLPQRGVKWRLTGDRIEIGPYGEVKRLEGPTGEVLDLADSQFVPDRPGFYSLKTDKGAFSFGVNVARSESLPRSDTAPVGSTEDLAGRKEAKTVFELWPFFGLSVLLLALLESLLYEVGSIRPEKIWRFSDRNRG